MSLSFRVSNKTNYTEGPFQFFGISDLLQSWRLFPLDSFPEYFVRAFMLPEVGDEPIIPIAI